MDLWTYLRALGRWWWLLLATPLLAFLLSFFVLFPTAPWQSTWTTLITFEGNPAKANSFSYVDFIVLDDLERLIHTDVVGDLLYLRLPDDVTSRYSRDEVGQMFTTYRHARFVQTWVTGDDPEVVSALATTMEALLPEAVNEYLVPADSTAYPGQVKTMDRITEPARQSRDRWLGIGAVTGAGLVAGGCLVGVAEWMRMSYRAKYGAR